MKQSCGTLCAISWLHRPFHKIIAKDVGNCQAVVVVHLPLKPIHHDNRKGLSLRGWGQISKSEQYVKHHCDPLRSRGANSLRADRLEPEKDRPICPRALRVPFWDAIKLDPSTIALSKLTATLCEAEAPIHCAQTPFTGRPPPTLPQSALSPLFWDTIKLDRALLI
jgi:hypothetical protein